MKNTHLGLCFSIKYKASAPEASENHASGSEEGEVCEGNVTQCWLRN